VARVEGDEIDLVIHWQGGDHTNLKVRKNKTGQHRWAVEAETADLIRALARLMPDKAIAAVLNRAGKRTGRGNTWTQARVRSFRNDHGIAVYREGERAERGELTLQEAAARLSTSKMTVLRLIRAGVLRAHQICKGAPWVIEAQALAEPGIAALSRSGRHRPVTSDPDQITLDL